MTLKDEREEIDVTCFTVLSQRTTAKQPDMQPVLRSKFEQTKGGN
jgi:hypothetical protein